MPVCKKHILPMVLGCLVVFGMVAHKEPVRSGIEVEEISSFVLPAEDIEISHEAKHKENLLTSSYHVPAFTARSVKCTVEISERRDESTIFPFGCTTLIHRGAGNIAGLRLESEVLPFFKHSRYGFSAILDSANNLYELSGLILGNRRYFTNEPSPLRVFQGLSTDSGGFSGRSQFLRLASYSSESSQSDDGGPDSGYDERKIGPVNIPPWWPPHWFVLGLILAIPGGWIFYDDDRFRSRWIRFLGIAAFCGGLFLLLPPHLWSGW